MARGTHYSYQDYLSTLEVSELKLEYCEGVIYAMAGGTPTHAELSVNSAAILKRELTKCSVFSSDLKVRIEHSSIDKNALTNPVILVEVTSPSTEDHDRGEKLSHYKQLPSLAAVLFVSHRTQRVTVVRRAATGWEELEFRAGERVVLQKPALSFPVDEVYANVTLES